MDNEVVLKDISEELLILNRVTIDKLFQLDNCVECISLYIFYYKTAKWQKTNIVKANDVYVAKSLKWGKNKITKIKDILKENGLINIVQRRNNGKIIGWYVEVCYLMNQKTTNDIRIKVEESNNPSEQEVVETRTCSEDTNALKEEIKCLKKKIEILEKKAKKEFVPPTLEEIKEYCLQRKNNVNYKKFYDYYTENNWKDNQGKQVNNWKLKVISWEGNATSSYGNNNTAKVDTKLPSWFGKDIQPTEATEEEKAEMERVMAELDELL